MDICENTQWKGSWSPCGWRSMGWVARHLSSKLTKRKLSEIYAKTLQPGLTWRLGPDLCWPLVATSSTIAKDCGDKSVIWLQGKSLILYVTNQQISFFFFFKFSLRMSLPCNQRWWRNYLCGPASLGRSSTSEFFAIALKRNPTTLVYRRWHHWCHCLLNIRWSFQLEFGWCQTAKGTAEFDLWHAVQPKLSRSDSAK